ncbi:TPA: hypothetical protein HA235_01275 [Candidatus Woesearchaeota archaeon]|nr:hypothetical protein [Candidatus Woesearchaeota archaeon]HIH31315.1 hypothetical protein [Candidatus Woesearchaeota archaeon]HIH55394.1 hypothetical protein [Candidatus Woesearchaeota archaeon]HIJ01586.1 hypothetical protein [Candidatus Woesearchaeota archaeon]HIJ14585.1 hypothetical protein [Candidatus Woesearchaeota archaeon]
MLLTHVEIKGQKIDTEKIIFYGRNNDGLEKLEEEIYSFNTLFNDLRPTKVFALSYSTSEDVLKKRLIDLESNQAFKKLNFKTIKKDENYIIYAEGNTKILKKLPAYFKIKPGSNNFSSVELLRKQLRFPFSLIKKHNAIWMVDRQLSLDEFLMLNSASLDSEFMHWEKEKKVDYLNNSREQKMDFLTNTYNILTGQESEDELTKKIVDFFNENKGKQGIIDKPLSVSLAINKKNIRIDADNKMNYDLCIDKVYHLCHLGEESQDMMMDLATGKTNVIFIKNQDELEMIKRLNLAVEKEKILIFLTQNGPKYDLPKLREFGLKFFNEMPEIKSSAGFFYQTIIKGNIILDLASYSQNYFPWTIDNKYATIIKLITGMDFEKSITYDDQTRLTLEAILGNNESIKIMRKYDVEDVTGMSMTEKYILPMIYFKSKIARTSPEVINVTSKANWALDLYRYEYLLEGKGFWTVTKYKEYNKFQTFDKFKKLVKEYESMREKPKRINVVKNFTRGALFYIAPFTSIHHHEIQKKTAIKEAFDYLKRPDATNLEKIDLILTIEEGYLKPYLFDNSLNKSSREKDIVNQFRNLVRAFPPINNNDNYYCFKIRDSEHPYFKENMKGLGIELSRGKFFNVKKGSFILYDERNFYKKDIDAKGKAGYKTIYQQELIHDYIELLFKKGPDEAIKTIVEFFKKLNNNSLDRNKMIYFKESMIKDYFDYSSYAQQQERVQAYIELGLKKDEKAAFFKLGKVHVPLEHFEQMPDSYIFSDKIKDQLIQDYLGTIEKRNINMQEGKIGKYIQPLAKYYGLNKNLFSRFILAGDYESIVHNKKDLFSDIFKE